MKLVLILILWWGTIILSAVRPGFKPRSLHPRHPFGLGKHRRLFQVGGLLK